MQRTRHESGVLFHLKKTAFKTQRVKITLAINTVSGWNEIDAVQLIGE